MEGPHRSAVESSDWPGFARLGFAWRAWLSIDPRSLGLFRIVFGLILLWHGWTRWEVAADLFAADGPVPARFLPQVGEIVYWPSLLSWLEQWPWGVPAFAAATAVVYALFTLGWRTRVMSALCLVAFSSMAHRNPYLLIGADEVIASMLLWSTMLPLGARFSLDARRGSQRRDALRDAAGGRDAADANPVVSLACLGILMQIALVYGTTAWLKAGPSWWRDGTAIARVLHMETFVRPGAAVLDKLPPAAIAFITRAVLLVEYAIPLAILFPFARPWGRRAAALMILGLHAGIALSLCTGMFSMVMSSLTPLLLSAEDWTLLARFVERWWNAPATSLHAPPVQNGPVRIASVHRAMWASRLVEAASAFLLAGVLVINWNYAFATPSWRVRAPWLEAPWRFAAAGQRWHMFAPDPPAFDTQMTFVLRSWGDEQTAAWASLDAGVSDAAAEPRRRRSFVWKAFLLRSVEMSVPSRAAEAAALRRELCRFFAEDAERRRVAPATGLREVELWAARVPSDPNLRNQGTAAECVARYQVPQRHDADQDLRQNQEPTEPTGTMNQVEPPLAE